MFGNFNQFGQLIELLESSSSSVAGQAATATATTAGYEATRYSSSKASISIAMDGPMAVFPQMTLLERLDEAYPDPVSS